MWTQIVKTKGTDDDANISLVVEFTNGGKRVVTKNLFGPTLDNVKAQALYWVTRFTATDEVLASDELEEGKGLDLTVKPPPPNPNEGLAQLSIAGLLGLLSEKSVARLCGLSGALDALRRDVQMQDRPAIAHWIAIFAARPTGDGESEGIITREEAALCLSSLEAKA